MCEVSTWTFRSRDYDRESKAHGLAGTGVDEHPLLAVKKKKQKVVATPTKNGPTPSKKAEEPKKAVEPTPLDDPLSMLLDGPTMIDEDMEEEVVAKPSSSKKKKDTAWTFAKQAMLRDFGGDGSRAALQFSKELASGARPLPKKGFGKIEILDYDDDESRLVRSTKAPKMVERSAARLRQLSEKKVEEVETTHFAQTAEKIFTQLQRAWANDERVLALKLAIQAAKMLQTPSAKYPAIFVLATDVLDAFGSYVFDRIEEKKFANGLNDAKETCRNWFYKTACIREVLPRFYVEVALVQCYAFLSPEELPKILARLGHIARGLGHPLVAAYARAYLARIGRDIHFVGGMLQDFLFTFQAVKPKDKKSFLTLASPALAWLAECCQTSQEEEDASFFDAVLAQYRDYCNDATVLVHVVDAFEPQRVSDRAAALVTLAKRAEPSNVSTVALLGKLGAIFAKAPPPKHHRLPVLNEVWKVVARCNDLADYVDCATHWLDCLLKHYSDREVKVLLNDVVAHVEHAVSRGDLQVKTTSREEDDKDQAVAAQRLEDLVQMLVESCGTKNNFSQSSVVLASDHLLKLLDLFRPHRKVEIAKELLAGTAGGDKKKRFKDPVLIGTVLEIARVAHDSLDSLSPDGERKHVASLILGFVDHIDMGRDLERQLGVYVECRAAFPNLDAVLDRLVVLTAKLAVDAKKIVVSSKKPSKAVTDRVLNFAKACLAYAHVTVPSINSLFRRLDLLVLLGHVALIQNCLPHADTFFKAAVALVPELPRKADGRADDPEPEDELVDAPPSDNDGEALLAKTMTKLAASLIVVPGRPDHGPFYLVQGLLNALPRYQYWRLASGKRIDAYLAFIPLLAAFAQRKLPYSTPSVEGNDVLYGGEPDYFTEIKTHLATVMARIIQDLTDLAKDDHLAVRPTKILDLVSVIHAHFLLQGDAKSFVSKLIGLVQKNPSQNIQPYLDATITLISSTAAKK